MTPFRSTGGRPADFLSPECQEPPRRLKQRREQQQGGAEPDRQAEEQAKAGQEAAQRAALGQGLVARDQRRVKQHSRHKVPSGIPSPRLSPPAAVAVSAAFPSGASDGMASAVTAWRRGPPGVTASKGQQGNGRADGGERVCQNVWKSG